MWYYNSHWNRKNCENVHKFDRLLTVWNYSSFIETILDTQKRLELASYSRVDWKLRATGMKNITKQYQRWLCKFNTDFCGVGNMLVRYKYQMNSKCSSCGKEKKHTDHAILCQEQGASLIWTNKMKKLEDWMTSQDFHPKIVQVIVTGLHSWRTNTPNTYLPLNIHLQQAQTHQAQIGWFCFIEGFWTN